MTYAMHTIGFLDLKDEVEAARMFERSYSLNIREPFKVWSENLPGVPGAGNFITGAGGFLQSLINGYGGVRLHFDSLTISNFYVPPQSTTLEFNGITYLHNQFSLTVSFDEATITFKKLHRDHPIKITLGDRDFTPVVGNAIKLKRSDELVMKATIKPFGACELKETVLGEKAGGVTLRTSILVVLIGFISLMF